MSALMGRLARAEMREALLDSVRCAPMVVADIDEVFAVEQAVYPHPWSRANFVDSLSSGYHGWVLRDGAGVLAGYFLVMAVVDEAHLLNVAVAAPYQRNGLGLYLLDRIVACARGLGMGSILLEVRPTNVRALSVYLRYGFKEIGKRKGYYPAHNGKREDAIVMRYTL